VPSILTRLGAPLLQVGDLVFDCEVSVARGGDREVSEFRLASGAQVLEHSRRPPRVYQLEGAVSVLPQPQNFGRPGAPAFDATTFAGLPLVGALVPLEVTTRLQDFETRLDALQDDDVFGVLEIIDQVIGRKTCVLTSWRAVNSGSDPMAGGGAVYALTLREIQRAGLTIADATPDALALNGSGGVVKPGGGGPSQATPMMLDVVP
jgi:hypothetical protein